METIREILNQYAAEYQPSHAEPLGSAGGMSGAQFWRLTTPRGTLALRRWPTEHPAPEQLQFIHKVLSHAQRRGIAVLPIPITTRDGRSFIAHEGHLWELAPWMPGRADYAHAPTAEKLRAAMTFLAQFHLAVVDFAHPLSSGSSTGSPAITSRIARLNELAAGGQQQLAAEITDNVWPQLSPIAREFLAVLPRALPLAIALHEPLANLSFSLQTCLRDIWHDHVLFSGERVTGVIDFGAMDIDTPACDVARLLGGLVGDDMTSRQIGLSAYDNVRKLSLNEMQAVAAFDTSIILLAGCNWIRWIYCEGRQFENPAQILQYFRRIVERSRRMVCAKE
jgi:homoserine kinase type II